MFNTTTSSRQSKPAKGDWLSDRFSKQDIMEMSVLGKSMFVYLVRDR